MFDVFDFYAIYTLRQIIRLIKNFFFKSTLNLNNKILISNFDFFKIGFQGKYSKFTYLSHRTKFIIFTILILV